MMSRLPGGVADKENGRKQLGGTSVAIQMS